MSTYDSIIGLYIRIDMLMPDVPKHPDARLYPSVDMIICSPCTDIDRIIMY